tara:strand:- start:1190 stop:1321 length:132 start_codon:yes stop_codon:yes gene_type:complete
LNNENSGVDYFTGNLVLKKGTKVYFPMNFNEKLQYGDLQEKYY